VAKIIKFGHKKAPKFRGAYVLTVFMNW